MKKKQQNKKHLNIVIKDENQGQQDAQSAEQETKRDTENIR